ncbi:MAG TPA: undecaprenyl-phosphate glucose phosphotransferase [Candidatus Limnocylindrales bacterium]|nr:undecaprenyl-phosphate glucose phosphotransferase [Candidatus Limnocylindrales bacterium]
MASLKKNHPLILTGLVTIDLIATALSLLLAYTLRFYTDIVPVTKGIPPLSLYLQALYPILVIWPIVFKLCGLYLPRRGHSKIDEFVTVFQAVTLGTLFLITFNFFFFPLTTYSRLGLLYFWAIDVFLIGIGRALFHDLISYARSKGYNLRHILIAGAGELGQLLVRKARYYSGLGLNVRGFVDDDPAKQGKIIEGVPVLGTLDDLREVIQTHQIQQLFIALPLSAHERLLSILNTLDREYVDIKVVPDLVQYVALKGGVDELDGIPIVTLRETPLQGWNSIIKRGFDILLSLIGIILFAPIMIILAILIKLTSPGPIFYVQQRMGLDGRVFNMYKFRSMYVNAEQRTGAVWAKKNDPRRTKIGAFMRRTSLDELPQLFNVLKGEMSLVGPRPERPPFVEQFTEKFPQYILRHKVKSGMTGWAQVNGWRGNTSIEKRIEYDLYYIANWSLLFDIKILLLTLWKGMVNDHAY